MSKLYIALAIELAIYNCLQLGLSIYSYGGIAIYSL